MEGKKAAEVLEKQVKEKRRASTKDSRVSAGSLLSGRNLCALVRAPPTHAFSGLVGVCLAERALKRTNEREGTYMYVHAKGATKKKY